MILQKNNYEKQINKILNSFFNETIEKINNIVKILANGKINDYEAKTFYNFF